MGYAESFKSKLEVHTSIHLSRSPCSKLHSSQNKTLGWFKNPISSQTEKLMAGTKFSDSLGLNHYKKAKKLKHFIHLNFTYRPQSFGS
jgi:hypothetical protein